MQRLSLILALCALLACLTVSLPSQAVPVRSAGVLVAQATPTPSPTPTQYIQGLNLSRKTAYGVSANWHMVSHIDAWLSAHPQTLNVEILGYTSAADYATGAAPIARYTYALQLIATAPTAPNQLPYDPTRSVSDQVYTYLMALPEWSGSTATYGTVVIP